MGQRDGMDFPADLHVPSKYSRATSRDLDLEHLAWWAARKGSAVVGTGDCVHPAWLAEIKDKLAPAGGGLFSLKPEIEAEIWKTLPPSCRTAVRFMLSVEISTIYKKGERTRKIHHLIYVPDFDAADRLAASLGRIGNIASDGRNSLGRESRDLLEVALSSGPHCFLVPAHIWTPWFAALGSQSGFDSINECYGDLSNHIFAVETGLSSDPAMNWRVSFLDRYRLTSNSDAHSPGKLGREAARFSCEPDLVAIRRALETGEGYEGTVEFFPEEGKYHLDGHRACGVRLDPAETIAHDGRCPVCGNRVTFGVAHRVEMLADRKEADALPPPTAGAVTSLVPLPEILSEIVGGGVGTLAALDGDQARAAEAADGPLIVMAGPGSGKTRMLTHRLAHLVLERGVPAAACLAVTFTRRAAEELRGRLAALLPPSAGACAVHSFHSLGLAILRANGAAAGLKADFRIADEPERRAALATELGVTEGKAARLLKAISRLKRTGLKPDDAEAAAALAACRQLAMEQNWVAFEALVRLAVGILETNTQLAALWQNRFSHLCVDEFQDVAEQQYRLLRRLAPPTGNICVIGDPNQAIYGFRGATAACFARFRLDFPSARTMRLKRNYRSAGTIVTAAAQVIGEGTPEDIMRPMQDPVIVHAPSTEHSEAALVTATIASLLARPHLF